MNKIELRVWLCLTPLLSILSCDKQEDLTVLTPDPPNEDISFYKGADLSYVNEMIDCNAVYYNSYNVVQDPFEIFDDAGANLIRTRLWHNPTWTNYSNFEDVKLTISKALSRGMRSLLDFHYSDTWADPSHQLVPSAWAEVVNNRPVLGDSLYNYTFAVLQKLKNANALPNIVQIGNETNAMILQEGSPIWPIDWARNAYLLNKGIAAVKDFSQANNVNIEIMLHIAQPENGLWWFEQAENSGVTDYDWIGLSYYPRWSDYNIETLGSAIETLIATYGKRLMIVETAYPYTLQDVDDANNVLGESALVSGYPASDQGQFDYLIALTETVSEAGGEGIVYWEPAWISTDCFTLWGQGSHWDNATLFNHQRKPTLGMSWYSN